MRHFVLACLTVIFAAAACSGPVEPELTEIVVTVDWPVAREPGFVDALWQLIRYDPESPVLLGPRGPVLQSGVIGPTGMFTVRHSASCGGGEFGFTGHRIEVFGHFTADDEGPIPECAMWAPHWCTSVPQTVTLQSNPPVEGCKTPDS